MKLNCTFAVKSCGCLWMLIFGFPLYLQHVHASCSYRDAVDFEEVKKKYRKRPNIQSLYDFEQPIKHDKV